MVFLVWTVCHSSPLDPKTCADVELENHEWEIKTITSAIKHYLRCINKGIKTFSHSLWIENASVNKWPLLPKLSTKPLFFSHNKQIVDLHWCTQCQKLPWLNRIIKSHTKKLKPCHQKCALFTSSGCFINIDKLTPLTPDVRYPLSCWVQVGVMCPLNKL